MLKKLSYAVLISALAWTFGCNDDPSRPPAPAPPPQLPLVVFNASPSTPASRRLPDNEVFDIFEDSQGRIWFSTDAGVAMKDGSADIVVFDDFAGIPNRKCRNVTELNGKIWVGTWGGGVASYDGTLPWVALPIANNRIVDGQVFDLAADDSSIWAGTVAGLSQYIDDPTRPEFQRFKQYTNRLGSDPGDLVISAVVPHDSPTRGPEVWVAKRGIPSQPGGGISVIKFPFGATHFRPDNTAIPGRELSDLVYDTTRGVFWATFPNDGLAWVDVDSSVWKRFTTAEGFMSDVMYSVAVKSNGDVWVGSAKGVTRMAANGNITNFPRGSGLPDARVRVVYVDSQDRVWLAFVGAGAARAK